MSSIFSKIIAGDIPCHKIAENDKFFVFLDIRPLAKGHTLVVPKQEIDYIFDIDDATLAEMHLYSKKIAAALRKAIPCKRIGVMVVGLEVPHAHIHLIPLNSEQDIVLTNPRLQFSQEEYAQIAEAIRLQLA